LRDRDVFERDCSADANPKWRSESRNYYEIRLTHSSIYWFLNIRISERRLIYAIKNVSRIQLARLSKILLFFKKLFSFLIFNPAIPISLFPIILAVRFPYLFSLSVVFSCSVEDDGLFERKEILREWFIDQHIYVWICIDMLRYNGACIYYAALSRLGLAPYSPLVKISADP
jgi:hypothetical protein